MSCTERNKGKLTPVTIEDIKKEYPSEFKPEDPDFEEGEFFYETSGKYVKLKGQYYKIDWEARGDTDLDFADVTKQEDGSILFHTMHYNGGAYWTEVVEDEL